MNEKPQKYDLSVCVILSQIVSSDLLRQDSQQQSTSEVSNLLSDDL